ncbi:MAG: 2-oxoglutarate and iron-dependent oxygenase domain-containing protein [Steroidobacteraceae bacterium]
MSLPILDLRDFTASAGQPQFLDSLRAAARNVGFFYLVGHGLPSSQMQALFDLSRTFFALPEADKQEIQMANSRHFRGYTRLGHERTGGNVDWREQIDIGLEVPTLEVKEGEPPWRRLQGPNQWPRALPALRKAFLDWHEDVGGVARRLLQAFALALEQPANRFDVLLQPLPNQVVKTIRYPGREGAAEGQGCGAHKDSELLTLLLQDEVGGLQAQDLNGCWIDVPPVAGSFVVNTGELLELATNGYLRATVHRVLAPAAGVERFSIAFFLGAGLGGTVPQLTLPPRLAADARGPASDPANPLYRDVGLNTLKGRLRSHPDVAARHYADVTAAMLGLQPLLPGT